MKQHYDSMDIKKRLIWNLWGIGHTMRHISEGKGSQKRVLMTLLENEPMTQRELTEELGIQPGSASEVVGKLETAGLLIRNPSETDRRTANIVLTETGKAVAEDALAQRRERYLKMFSGLSGEEQDMLLHLLEKLNADWDTKFRSNGAESDCRKDRRYRRHPLRHREE